MGAFVDGPPPPELDQLFTEIAKLKAEVREATEAYHKKIKTAVALREENERLKAEAREKDERIERGVQQELDLAQMVRDYEAEVSRLKGELEKEKEWAAYGRSVKSRL